MPSTEHGDERHRDEVTPMRVHVELLVEPFREGAPGPHVVAALEALEGAGLEVELGPFSSTADGDLAAVALALAEVVVASMGAGATRIAVQVSALG